MTRDESLFKIGISLDLQILGKFWDNINTQLHEIYNTVQVVFGNLITKILHIVPLSRKNTLHRARINSGVHYFLRIQRPIVNYSLHIFCLLTNFKSKLTK